MKIRRNQSGFTLIELMAAIGVAGLLMVIAMPIFTKTLPGLRLNDAARQIATDLQQVRMRGDSPEYSAPDQFLDDDVHGPALQW